uniref:Putative membrane protein n=1 Tax=Anopheles darlingi TaxID=43151 RepID=A0A2M4DS63_ANODA
MIARSCIVLLPYLVSKFCSSVGFFQFFQSSLLRPDVFRLLVQFIQLSYLTIARLLTISMVKCSCNTHPSHCCSFCKRFSISFFLPFHSLSASTAGYSRCSTDSGDSFRFFLLLQTWVLYAFVKFSSKG